MTRNIALSANDAAAKFVESNLQRKSRKWIASEHIGRCSQMEMSVPIENPTEYTDKTDDWMTFFQNVRRRELSAMIVPEVIAAHREDPRGQNTRHSESLQQLLNHIHNMPTDGKSFVYAETPHAVYKLGIMHARGVPPTIFHDTIYPTEKEAVHAVFLQRLEQFGITSEGNV